jgi:hypothetical protein
MTDEKLKALAEKTPKDFGPNDDTWRYIEAVGPEVVLKLLARIAALRDELACDVQNYWAKQKGKPMSCLEATRNRPLWCHNCQAIAADDEAQAHD